MEFRPIEATINIGQAYAPSQGFSADSAAFLVRLLKHIQQNVASET
jgi:hypothetical protein